MSEQIQEAEVYDDVFLLHWFWALIWTIWVGYTALIQYVYIFTKVWENGTWRMVEKNYIDERLLFNVTFV